VSKIPIACTLAANELVDRGSEWARMIERATAQEMTDEGARLTFAREPALASDLADLVAREVDCCGFFTFTLRVSHDEIALFVSAPPDARALVEAFARVR
jgi:NAD(P)-dependent dehydrogenase (short-subunit alcohol dehydrogenase family)